MIAEIKELTDQYARWLHEKTKLREVNGIVEITTPFLDRHNDHLQIFAVRKNDSFLLTDDGNTIGDLELSGLTLTTRREQMLKQILNGFGVHRNDDALEVMTSPETFARKKHCLVQAMLAVNDLFCLASPMVHSLFFEDIARWMDLSDIRYTPQVKITGKSGFDHVFDFVIPKTRKQPERVLRAINHPDRTSAQSLAFAWTDSRVVRQSESVAFAILNDTDRRVSGQVTEALQNYGVEPLFWSERESFKEKLIA